LRDAGIPSTTTVVTDWDVPLLSEDFDGSMSAIHAQAETLAQELAATP